jgi:hypothetical protein
MISNREGVGKNIDLKALSPFLESKRQAFKKFHEKKSIY